MSEMTTDSAAPKCVLEDHQICNLAALYNMPVMPPAQLIEFARAIEFQSQKLSVEALSAKLGRQDELRKYTIWQERPIAARDEGLTLRELFNMSDWSCDEVNKLACLNAGESISVDGLITVERTK